MNVEEKKTFDITGITEEERRLLSLALEFYVSSVTEGNDNNWAQTIQMAVRLKHILNGTLDERRRFNQEAEVLFEPSARR